jgi:hypothetical protein
MIQRKAGSRALGQSALIFCLVFCAIVPRVTQASPSDLGLAVNSQGTLTRHGVPYRGIGVNYYDAFLRVLRDRNDDSYKQGFAALGSNGIPFARINAGSFLPSDVRLYLDNKEEYLQRLDGVVRAAEKSHVGLIPSLFWVPYAISDAVNEPRESWRDSGSQTRKLMRQYTQDVVTRYVNSPAIWGWEFSCELSLAVDSRARPGDSNHLDYDTFRNAALDFAQVVRKIDPDRIVVTGNSLPRINAYHNATFAPNGPDTKEQFAHILIRDNPGPFSPICIHSSPAIIGRYFADRRVSFQQLLETCVDIGQRVHKPVYLEEFIPMPKGGGLPPEQQREYFTRELAAIEASKVPIASVWVYDRKLAHDYFSLTFDNKWSYMMRMIADFDQSVHAQQ